METEEMNKFYYELLIKRLNDLFYNSSIVNEEYQPTIIKKTIKEKEEKMDSNLILAVEYTNKSTSYGHSRIMKISKNGSTIFRFDAIPYPECCGICIFKNISLSEVSRTEFSEMMDTIIKHLQAEDLFSKILVYSTDTSRIAKELSRFNGAIMTDLFKNRRSGNMLAGFEININPDKNNNIHEDEEEDEDYEELLEGDEEDDIIENEIYPEIQTLNDLLSPPLRF